MGFAADVDAFGQQVHWQRGCGAALLWAQSNLDTADKTGPLNPDLTEFPLPLDQFTACLLTDGAVPCT